MGDVGTYMRVVGRVRWVGLALLAAICACTAPGAVGDSTATPTVTLTVGAGTVYPTASPVTPTTPAPTPQPAPTSTVFALPPTPGMTATDTHATMPPHITATPGANDPRIEFFTASPTDIDPGGSLTLRWKGNGDKAILYALN